MLSYATSLENANNRSYILRPEGSPTDSVSLSDLAHLRKESAFSIVKNIYFR